MAHSSKVRFRRLLKRISVKNVKVKQGYFGLKSLESGYISKEHLNHILNSLRQTSKQRIKVISFLNFSHPTTSKPIEVRMGKGKGSINRVLAKVKRGSILLEILTLNQNFLFAALRQISVKLPIKTIVIKRDVF